MKNNFITFLMIILNIYIISAKNFNLRNTASCQDYTFLPIEENVKIIGRYYQNKGATWIIYSGSALEFYASGNYLEFNLLGDNNIYQEEQYRPRYAIYIDDKLLIDTKMSSLQFSVKFKISNDDTKKSKIKIMLLSENQNGGVGIKNIKVNSCSNEEKIIYPTKKKKISIEFIGDSITNAYGVEAINQSYPFTTTTENFSKSYAYLAAKILDADYSSVSLSGHGIVSGYSTGDKWAEGLIPLYYEKISKNEEYPGDWDFEKHKYDVVFINLGTNDANYVNADRENREDEFVEEFANFLHTVRKKNPDSYILCTLGTLNPKDMYVLVKKGIKLFGGDRISSFESPVQDMNDGLGADWHPSKITQEKLSELVAEKIKEILE